MSKRAVAPSVVVAIASLLYSAAAGAHSTGVSTGEIVAQPDGQVDADLVFSAAELAAAVPLDRDHDGVVTEEEVAAAKPDLLGLVVDGIEIDADGAPCPASAESVAMVDGDAVELRATYACPVGAAKLGVTLFFLSDLRPQHRHALTLTAGDRTTQALLSGASRSAAIELDVPSHALPLWRRRGVVSACVVVAACMVAFAAWRRRRRAPRTNSSRAPE